MPANIHIRVTELQCHDEQTRVQGLNGEDKMHASVRPRRSPEFPAALQLAAVFVTFLPMVVHAGVYSYVYTGNVNAGTTDTLGLFGPAGGALGGLSFTLSLDFDNTVGITSPVGGNGVAGGEELGEPNPIIYTTITINSISQPINTNGGTSATAVQVCGTQCQLNPSQSQALNLLSSVSGVEVFAPLATTTPSLTSVTQTGTYTIGGGGGNLSVFTPGASTSEALNLTPKSLVISRLADLEGSAVVNVPAVQSGYFGPGGEYVVGSFVGNPIFVVLAPDCYSVVDAYGSGQAGVQFDALNYHNGVANDWAWQYRAINPNSGVTLAYVAAPTNEMPATTYSTEALAASAGQKASRGSFCLTSEMAVGFVIDDSYLPDNVGGVSLIITPTGAAPAGDSPLPLWALGALGAGLVGIVARRLKKT